MGMVDSRRAPIHATVSMRHSARAISSITHLHCARVSDAAIRLSGLRKSYGDVRGGPRHRPRGPGRRGLRVPRPERRREDHDGRDPRGLPAATPARSSVLGSTRRTPTRAWRGADRDRPAAVPDRPGAHRERDARAVRGLLPGAARRRGDDRLVGLEEKADVRAAISPGGQQRRLDVGLALIGDPELLFLDEPTTGFDPSARRDAWDVIASLRTSARRSS